jgi:hypothetical protein
MRLEADEGAIQSDAYIDALLAGHARLPIPLPAHTLTPSTGVRHVIRVLEAGLPRFHPSFLFEERLSGQLAAAAQTAQRASPGGIEPAAAVDRRLLIGGAVASGVSLAGAAMLAWRRSRD